MGSGRAVAERARSARAVTVVGSVAVLLARLGSASTPVTVAVLVTLLGAVELTPTLMPTVEVVPAGMGWVLVQVTVWPTARQLQPVPLPVRKLSPAGRVSVILIGALACEGPLLMTVAV